MKRSRTKADGCLSSDAAGVEVPEGAGQAGCGSRLASGIVPYRRRQGDKIVTMEVQLTADQKAFVRKAVESGRYKREEDALLEAFSLWETQERRRVEILAAVDQAEASLGRGEGRRITTPDQTSQLADEIKRRGLSRLAAEDNKR